MTEAVNNSKDVAPLDPPPIEEKEEPLTGRDILKIAGLVIGGILLILLVFGVFRYLLVSEYGGF